MMNKRDFERFHDKYIDFVDENRKYLMESGLFVEEDKLLNLYIQLKMLSTLERISDKLDDIHNEIQEPQFITNADSPLHKAIKDIDRIENYLNEIKEIIEAKNE